VKIKTKWLVGIGALSAVLLSLGTAAGAGVLDLSSGLPASGNIGDALFFASDQQAAGTGFIDPFLRVQGNGKGTFEQGYNTDGGFPFDDKHPHNFQHSLLLSSLAQFNVNGIEYFRFMLDGNQSGKGSTNHTFTLTQLQLYTSNDPAQATTTFNPDGTLPLGDLVYDLNPGGGTSNSVKTTATGSGKFDAIVDVPVSDFNTSDKYVYLYFAGNGNGGFEEWTAATGVSQIPEPSSLTLVSVTLAALLSFKSCLWRRMSS
jgi:hypothetical protein